MKKNLKKALALVFALAILTCGASAAIQSSDYLDRYYAETIVEGGGELSVYVSINALRPMTSIGATQITVYESTNGGSSFSFYKSFSFYDNPAMLGSGWAYKDTAITFDATPGRQYQALVYCHAGDNTGGDTKTYLTEIVTAR